MKHVIGLLNFHDSPEAEGLTASRPLGSTSFLGRYAICDFMMSNFANSGIDQTGLLIKDHQRSLLKHLGSMDAWVRNTKTARQIIMYNEPAHNHPETNTDLANIAENDWALYDSDARYLLVAPAHLVGKIDFRPFIEEHIARGEKMSLMAYKVKDPSAQFLSQDILDVSEEGYLQAAYPNGGTSKSEASVSLGIYLINRAYLADLVQRYLPKNPKLDLRTLVARVAEEEEKGVRVYYHEGMIACIDGYDAYVRIVKAFLKPENSAKIFDRDWPIFTKSHDTPPAIYGQDSSVHNCIVANGAIIEGEVSDSVISRNVKIAKGAIVRNCIILTATKIGEGAVVENCVIDKYAIITRKKKVGSAKGKPTYLAQGAIL